MSVNSTSKPYSKHRSSNSSSPIWEMLENLKGFLVIGNRNLVIFSMGVMGLDKIVNGDGGRERGTY